MDILYVSPASLDKKQVSYIMSYNMCMDDTTTHVKKNAVLSQPDESSPYPTH